MAGKVTMMPGRWMLFLSVLLPIGSTAQAEDGQRLFVENCSVCHRTNGEGLPPHYYPRLSGDAFLLGEDDKLILLLLNGRDGMPNLGRSLSDEQLATLLSYARGSWGNAAPPITAEQVKHLRMTLPDGGQTMMNN